MKMGRIDREPGSRTSDQRDTLDALIRASFAPASRAVREPLPAEWLALLRDGPAEGRPPE